MSQHRRLPQRELVFIASLRYHGFRYSQNRDNLKFNRAYVIPATAKEDASLVDFWVKLSRSNKLIPVQITQRGIGIFRRRQNPSAERLTEFAEAVEQRLRRKRKACIRYRIAFVLVRDFTGTKPPLSIAWGDRKALDFGLSALAA